MNPDVADLIAFEEERQARKLIMIPSESYCPKPVREALGSVFNNIYAEGYPRLQIKPNFHRLNRYSTEFVGRRG